MNQTHIRSEIVSKRFTMIFTSLVIVISLVVFIGWINGWMFLTKISVHEVSMAKSSVFLFFILSTCLLFPICFKTSQTVRHIVITALIIVICLLGFLFVLQLQRLITQSGLIYYKVIETAHLFQFGRLSIVTVVLFLINSFALLFLYSNKMLFKILSLIFSLIVLIISFLLLLGYGFNAPFFYIRNFAPPAFLTGLSFFFLSLGCLSALDNNVYIIRKVLGTQTSAKLFRVFLPITLSLTIVEGLLLVRILPNYIINPAIVVSIVTLFFAALIGLTITIVTQNIGRSLDTLTENLRISEEKMRHIIEGTPYFFFYTKDIEGNVTYISPSIEKITGHKVEKWIGQKLWNLTDSPINIHSKEDSHAHLGGKNTNGTTYLEIYHSNGSKILLESNEYPMTRNNIVIGLQGIAHDITERKKAEEEIIKANSELKRINSVKDKFFSIIAHDLKSPFQGLVGMTGMMAEDIYSFSQNELSEFSIKMHKSVKNLLKLLTNLLDWARMQQGTISYEPIDLILSKVIAQNINLINKSVEQKGIEIIIDVPNNQKVYADVEMLNSILGNLLSNAVKFSLKGGKIKVCLKETENSMVEIAVKDTGVGMSESLSEKLFKIDEQVGRKGTDGEESTGLGLLLCKEFVEKHGGKIWVETKENEGSTFYFTLPKIDLVLLDTNNRLN